MSSELAINGGPKTREKPWPTTGNASGRLFGQEEIELLTEVVQSGNLFRYGGKMVDQFEQEYAANVGIKHCVAVTSGSAAIHSAVAALQLEVGDEIITTTVTDIGSIMGILWCNQIPIFADVDRRTMIMRPDAIESQITDRTRAIIAVHLFGQPAPMDEIMAIAEKHNLYVIEDCAQAHGAEFDGKRVSTIGHLGCYSLQQSKQMTTGDGGMVVGNDDELMSRVRMFHDKYYERGGEMRGYTRLGICYRMNELTGAVALAQTRKLPEILRRRRASANALLEKISTIPGIKPPWIHPLANHAWWIFSFQIDEDVLKCDLPTFRSAIQAEGLPFGTGYAGGIPICMYPLFQEHSAYGSGSFPWEPPYGRRVEYKAEDYPETYWAQANTFITSWNEGFTEEDADDIYRGLKKVAEAYA
ncbi:MAG: DegT/DnrJ/EryC1/StrS family aminotransferase [Armatimonadetes bacterium]|nr:DegT/DnrJ/EryC1/StrS family aminotransferase [Armatimonadota bacterium]